jgi:hypothetical protein
MITKSVYLGQYTDEVANVIAEELEQAQISWSYKQPGFFTRAFFAGEWGTRLFVEESKLIEARRIADRVVARLHPGDDK